MRSCVTAILLLFTVMRGTLSAPPESEASMSKTAHPSRLRITIVYENTLAKPGLTAGWGFSALIKYDGHTLLFDTGADGQALLDNMAALDINPLEIESVVLSHNHSDHTGGLRALLATGAQPDVYLLPSFPATFKQQVGRATTVIETSPDQAITEKIVTTGEIDGGIPEQALAIEIEQGIVVITGCAHPGIVTIVEHIKETSGKPIYLVLGGFHLGNMTRAEIGNIVRAFRRLGVARVGPCHCTGERAMDAFAEEYGDDFIEIGTGTIIDIKAPASIPHSNSFHA